MQVECGMLLRLTLALLAATLITDAATSGGVLWDSLNVIGYAAFAGMLVLFSATGGARTRTHQLISYGVAATILVHTIGHIAVDATVWHYLNWDAPVYMLAGLAALAAGGGRGAIGVDVAGDVATWIGTRLVDVAHLGARALVVRIGVR